MARNGNSADQPLSGSVRQGLAAGPQSSLGLREGTVLGAPPQPDAAPARALIEVHAVCGPGAGTVFPLGLGSFGVGSGEQCAIHLPGAKETAAIVIVRADGGPAVVTDPSGAGTGAVRLLPVVAPQPLPAPSAPARPKPPPEPDQVPAGDPAGPADWAPGVDLAVGETLLRWVRPGEPDASVGPSADGAGLDFHRPPRLMEPLARHRFRIPGPPPPPGRRAFPIILMIAPLIMGTGMFFSFHQVVYLFFICLSPLLTAANWVNDRKTGRRDHRRRTVAHRQTRARLAAQPSPWLPALPPRLALGERTAARDAGVGPATRPLRIGVRPAELSFAAAYELVPAASRRPLCALLGVGGDEQAPVLVDFAGKSPAFTVVGPAGSGRSTVLATLAVSLLAGGTGIVALTPRASPLRRLAAHPRAVVLADPNPSAEQLDQAIAGLGAPCVVLVDDADLLVQMPAADAALRRVVACGRDRGLGLAAAGSAETFVQSMIGWLGETRRIRQGVLLGPATVGEGDLFGARIPPNQLRKPVQHGRGYVSDPLTGALVQIALPFTVLKEG